MIKDTVYLSLVRSNGAVRKIVGVRGGEHLAGDARKPAAVLKYMLAHFALVGCSLVLSAVTLTVDPLKMHLPLALAALGCAVWNGAAR